MTFNDYLDDLENKFGKDFVLYAKCSKQVWSDLIQCYKWKVCIVLIDSRSGFADIGTKVISIGNKMNLARKLSTITHEFHHIEHDWFVKTAGHLYDNEWEYTNERLRSEFDAHIKEVKAIKQLSKYLCLDYKQKNMLKLAKNLKTGEFAESLTASWVQEVFKPSQWNGYKRINWTTYTTRYRMGIQRLRASGLSRDVIING